jgi:signal transduction histidine kinase
VLNHLLSLLLVIASATALAQDYFQKRYEVKNGLPTNIIKATAQDSQGYFWIATDEGLVKYDGVDFYIYREILHSNYLKNFLTTRDGQLILIGDQDFILIENDGRDVRFTSILKVGRTETDSTLHFPKKAFEDQNGNIWISEPQSVVRYANGNMKRYQFGEEDRTTQFIRSFDFIEDKKGNLYTISYPGNVFIYSAETDSFEKTSIKFPMAVEFVGYIKEKLLVGAASGVYKGQLLEEGGMTNPNRIGNLSDVSYIEPLTIEECLIATRGNKHYLGNLATEEIGSFPYPVNNINHIFKSQEQDLWISSNNGWILTRKNIFHNPQPELPSFIEAVEEDMMTGTIYYATKDVLYEYNPESKEVRKFLDIPDGYFQALVSSQDGLWVANAFEVTLYDRTGTALTSYDFSEHGRFIATMSEDDEGNIWLTIPGIDQVNRIDRNRQLHHHSISLANGNEIIQVRSGPDGTYAIAAGKNEYMHFMRKGENVFKNISPPLDFVKSERFEATGIDFSKDAIWVASSEGLLKLSNQSITRIPLNKDFDKSPVRSVDMYVDGRLILSNAFGLLIYNPVTGTIDVFNESDGIPSRSVIAKAIMVTENGQVWTGTSQGIAYSSTSLESSTKTNTPKAISFAINGSEIPTIVNKKVDYNEHISVTISSITFPEQNITYQYRLYPTQDWQNTPPTILLTDLNADKFVLEVRAKKFGPYTWSELLKIPFEVTLPFYMQIWFFLLSALFVFIIILVTYKIVSIRSKARNAQLSALINEKTRELIKANNHLETVNKERNSLIQIMAHDLKNPIGQVMGFANLIKMDDANSEETHQYLQYIKQVSLKMSGLIEKILQLNQLESKEKKVNKERINLSEVIVSIIKEMNAHAESKNITVIQDIDKDIYCTTDYFLALQIFENLISNAFKFSFKGSTVSVRLKASMHNAIFEIEDGGPGLTESDMQKMFGKFQKLSATPTGDEPTTGLGLSIVKKLVEILNARIIVTSDKGKGACFTVTIPLT